MLRSANIGTWKVGLAVALAAMVGHSAYAQTPLSSAFTYQGQLRDGIGPVNGAYDMIFSLWTEQGTGSPPSGGAIVGEQVCLEDVPVTNGLFSVTLDFGASSFDGDERWLMVLVRPAAPLSSCLAGTYDVLAPRQRVSAAPYATMALTAETALEVQGVDGHSLDSPAGSEDVVAVGDNDDVAIGRYTALMPPMGEQDNLGPYAYSAAPPPVWQSFTAGQTGTLTTIHAFLDAPFDGDNITLTLRSDTGLGGAVLDISAITLPATPLFAAFPIDDVPITAGSTYTWSLSGSSALVGVSTSADPYPGGISSLGANTDLAFATVASWVAEMPTLFVANNGKVGVGTDAPAYKLDVADRVRVREGPSGTAGVHFYQAAPAEDRGFVGMFSDDYIGLWGSEGASWGLLMNVADGQVGIGTTSPQATLDVAGTVRSSSGGFQFPDGSIQTAAASSGPWQPQGGNLAYTGGNVSIGSTVSNGKLYITTGGGAQSSLVCEHDGSNFIVRPSIGGSTATVIENTAGELFLNPFRVTTVSALKILGGADIAEPFDVSDESAIEPGMVVSIDPDRPGKLCLARHAYDTRVAGVVSGAGGVNTGVVLRQEETLADGEHPVALTGRVYCCVDADAGGPIGPGDLLTTSDTPGHAMKAIDRSRTHGAAIGKAMTALERGRGLVLVLVNLQ